MKKTARHIVAMTLDAYLSENGISEAAFAQLVGTSQPNIHRMRKQGQTPNRALMAEIVKATGGKVQPNDFYGLDAA